MARSQDRHLNLHELRLFVSAHTSNGAEVDVSDADRLGLEEHLRLCNECHELSQQELVLSRISIRHQRGNQTATTLDCPSEREWSELAAGLHAPLDTHDRLEHAMHCAHCATLLKQAAEQFADEVTEEERQALGALQSTSAKWRKNLARRMQSLSTKDFPPSPGRNRGGVRSFLLQLTAGLFALVFLLSGVWWITNRRSNKVVDRLLSEAYSERRTLEMRMTGSNYSPVEAFRGSEASRMRRPTPLLEAEVAIAKELASKPDDPLWLDAQGRADLMDENYSSALSVLERAHGYATENLDIGIDLASAYFLRAEELKRPEDYGRAIDLLGQVLSKNPGNEIAHFNRAIALERLLLYEQAIEDWHRYLELDSDSRWSEEARKRLAGIEEKVQRQKNRSARPLLPPVEFLASLRRNRRGSNEELDRRIEEYFDLALRKWVPQAYFGTEATDAETARRASVGLAQILISKHADYWLADFLAELARRPASRKGLPFLTSALGTTENPDFDGARKAAIDASLSFHKSGNRAGELIARFESSYADQLGHQVANCLSETSAQNDPTVAQKYPWLRTQLMLESAACTNMNDEAARKLASQALTIAKLHRYPSLELRATAFLAALYQYMGDTTSAWKYSTEGLARYWEGDYPSVRGYSLYQGLDVVAEETEQWFLDVQVIQEAFTYLAEDPDLELRAIQQNRLAAALAMTADFTAAEQSIHEARSLFLRSADGARKNNLEFEAQVGLAKLELLRSAPKMAIDRLEPLRERVRGLSDKDLAFDYFRNLGLAYFAVGASALAKRDLADALALAEESLQTNGVERERLIWCRKTDRAYRALVQLNLAGSPRDAFAEWEWFKGASLRGSSSRREIPSARSDSFTLPNAPFPSIIVPSDTVVVSFAILPAGAFAWTYSHEGVRQHTLAVSSEEVELLARRFSDHCSRSDSHMATVAAESRMLYRMLFQPIEPFLQSYRHLVIEPDKALWLIPFESLLDTNGIYLQDRYAISLSPGLDYLALSPPWHGVSRESRILIAGDPPANGKKPLEDAEEEAKGIARQFRFSNLLLKDRADYRHIAEQMGDAEVFHFSGHAAASPDGVGLLLGDSFVVDAARIRVAEFSGLKLAVLSACSSANGGTGVFDDRDSLARLLVGAGVPEVVASRWMVNSRATSMLMQEFYAQLLSGKDASSSLREASRKLRTKGEFVHPFYWAGFSAFGKS